MPTEAAKLITQKFLKKDIPEIHPGDVVRVHQKIKEGQKERIQVFEGIVIARHGGGGINGTFTVRKIASGVGVEKSFMIHAPNIVKIEFKKGSKVRRAKLYYLRNLSGKSLRMKEKKLDKDVWELIAKEPAHQDESDAGQGTEEDKPVKKEVSKAEEKKEEPEKDGKPISPEGEPSAAGKEEAKDGKISEDDKKEAKKEETKPDTGKEADKK